MSKARAAAAAAALLTIAGCGGEEGTTAGTPAATGTTPTAEQAERRAVTVYFLAGEKLAPATHDVAASGALAPAVLAELLAGPAGGDEGLLSEIPAGTQLNSVEVQGGIATVDLSPEFAGGGGSASMQARVAQVVYTLTALTGIDRVSFQLDGERVEAIGGEGLMVEPPVGRDDFSALAA
jgi:germination protein M